MSIKPQPIASIPADTQRVARAAFPKGNPYVTLRDELGTVFEDTVLGDSGYRRVTTAG